MKKIRNLVLVLTLVMVSSVVSFRLGQRNVGETAEGLDLTMMWRVKSKLESLYLDRSKLVDEAMVQGAIAGMVDSAGDPYTRYLPPDDNKSSNDDLAGEFGGVGISLGYKDKTLAVMTPLPKTPADTAGLKAGDLIIKIVDEENGVDRDTTGISLDEAVKLIRGEIGTVVSLEIYREGDKDTFVVDLVRDNIVVASIEMEYIERDGKKFAWIRLYKFTERLYEEWDKIVEEVRRAGVDGVVLDLRNNPGGYLQASVEVASDFINDGVVVSQESLKGIDQVYRVDKSRTRLLSVPLVVLINKGSASASEILAGALRQHNRARLVGETSFGKGTVQQPENFSDGSGLHVTIARWLLPDGTSIDQSGVSPDVEVEDDYETEVDEQLEKAVEQFYND